MSSIPTNQIIETACQRDLVSAIEGLEAALESGPTAKRMIATAAALHFRNLQDLDNRIAEEIKHAGMFSPLVYVEEEEDQTPALPV